MLSKFDYASFCGGYDDFAVSKQRYTKEQAVELAREEFKHREHKYLFVANGYVRHRAGVDEDYKPCVSWWLEYEEHKRSCPCYVFHTSNDLSAKSNNEYEVLGLHEN